MHLYLRFKKKIKTEKSTTNQTHSSMVNTDIQMWNDSIEELRALTFNFSLHFIYEIPPNIQIMFYLLRSRVQYKLLIWIQDSNWNTTKSSGWFFNQIHVIGQRKFCLTLWEDVLWYCFVFHSSIIKWTRFNRYYGVISLCQT